MNLPLAISHVWRENFPEVEKLERERERRGGIISILSRTGIYISRPHLTEKRFARDSWDFLENKEIHKEIFLQKLDLLQVAFMHMNASSFDPYERPTVAKTILSSLRSAGISVNSISSWEESYRVVENLINPFHKLVDETHVEARSEYIICVGNVRYV